MSIFQKIASVFADKAIASKLENAAIAFVDNTFVDKNLEEGIIADLLETYGNEPFYNDFDGYITRNNVINNLIKSVRGNSSLQPNFRTGFIRENEARFLSQYPKYKHRPVHHSQICCIFEKIFDAVSLRINTLNPHSDIGKLQNTIAQFENESEFRDNRNYALSLESAKKIDYIYQHLSSQQSVADTTKQELIDCTKEVATFTEEIKKIETEYQQNDRMDDALSRYYELLQSITTKLRNQPENQIDALICSLYCNIALCQSNLGDAEKAFKSLNTISAPVAADSKTYHFVYASIIIQHTLSSQYDVAEQHLDRALEIDDAYQGAISFFVGNQRLIAEDFFNRIEKSSLSEACYYHIKASLSCATNDVPQLLESLNYLYETSHSFQDGFNKALCHRWLLNYDESLSECLVLLNNNPTEDEKVKIFWLISDLYLLKKEPDESYDWAKKAHDLKSNDPYDQSHSAFFGRSFRSGHHEGFAAVLEYKHTHPIVVDWIQEFNISETKNPLESISQQLEKHFPDQKNRQEQERQIASQYKQGIIPINVLLKYYNDDWWRLFQFAAENRLIVSHGNIKRLKLEQELIGDHLVVDAQTLIILAHYDCLASLQSIMMIHKRSRKRPGYFIMYVQFWRELRKSFRMMQKNGSNILS